MELEDDKLKNSYKFEKARSSSFCLCRLEEMKRLAIDNKGILQCLALEKMRRFLCKGKVYNEKKGEFRVRFLFFHDLLLKDVTLLYFYVNFSSFLL